MTAARPKVTNGQTTEMETGCGSLFVTVNFVDERPYEIFVMLGKSGGCSSCQNEALTRIITLALKNGIELPPIVKHLTGITCPGATISNGEKILSCADAIGKVLKTHLNGAHSEDDKG